MMIQSVLLGEVLDQIMKDGRARELGGIGRQRACGQHREVRVRRTANRGMHMDRSLQDVRESRLRTEPKHFVHTRAAHVAVDKERSLLRLRERAREIARDDGLPFRRRRARHEQRASALDIREDHGRAKRSQRLTKDGRHLRVQQRRHAVVVLRLHRRHHAEEWNVEIRLDVVRRLEAAVEELDAEPEHERDDAARHEKHERVARVIGRHGQRRHECRIDELRAAPHDRRGHGRCRGARRHRERRVTPSFRVSRLPLVNERIRQRIGGARREDRIGRSISHIDQMTVRHARDRHAPEKPFDLPGPPARLCADRRLRRRRAADQQRDLLDESWFERRDRRRHSLRLGRRRAHAERLDRPPDDDPALHEARLRLVKGIVNRRRRRSAAGFPRIGFDQQLRRRLVDRRLPEARGRAVRKDDEQGEHHRPAAPVHDAQVVPGNAASASHQPSLRSQFAAIEPLGQSNRGTKATPASSRGPAGRIPARRRGSPAQSGTGLTVL